MSSLRLRLLPVQFGRKRSGREPVLHDDAGDSDSPLGTSDSGGGCENGLYASPVGWTDLLSRGVCHFVFFSFALGVKPGLEPFLYIINRGGQHCGSVRAFGLHTCCIPHRLNKKSSPTADPLRSPSSLLPSFLVFNSLPITTPSPMAPPAFADIAKSANDACPRRTPIFLNSRSRW